MMCLGLAGGSGLEQAIVDAGADMPPQGLPVASERQVVRADALGSNERQGKSAAEDFALLTARTASARYAAYFLSTVGNVSFNHKDLKLSKYTQNYLKKYKTTSKM